MSAGVKDEPLFAELKQLFEPNDAEPLFEAIANNVTYFVTVDHKTILRHGQLLESKYRLKAVDPVQLVNEMGW